MTAWPFGTDADEHGPPATPHTTRTDGPTVLNHIDGITRVERLADAPAA